MKKRAAAILPAALIAAASALAEPGTLMRATELKAEPFADATAVAKLAENTKVDVLKRQGPWMRVKAAEGEGWVHMLAVRLGDGPKQASGSGDLGALGRLLGGGRSEPTVATGVRGLSAEDLHNAKPNPDELAKIERYAVGAPDAKRFAESGKLMPRQVAYFPEPGGSAPAREEK